MPGPQGVRLSICAQPTSPSCAWQPISSGLRQRLSLTNRKTQTHLSRPLLPPIASRMRTHVLHSDHEHTIAGPRTNAEVRLPARPGTATASSASRTPSSSARTRPQIERSISRCRTSLNQRNQALRPLSHTRPAPGERTSHAAQSENPRNPVDQSDAKHENGPKTH
jgi:hypothetical protein